MSKMKSLIKNTALLTGASLFMRFSGMIWQVWLAGRIGESGIGLFQLIMSVSGLAATLAVSGIRFTTTRLIAEELGMHRMNGVKSAVRRCLMYGGLFGALSTFVLFLLAEPIGFLWLGDARTVAPLRWLALGLPCLAFSAVIYGYFTATGRVWKGVCVQIAREFLMIGLTIWLLRNYRRGDLESACRTIAMGGTIADWIALILLILVFSFDIRKHIIAEKKGVVHGMTDRMLAIALPLAVASYARSALSTLQHLLVPKGLKRSGLSSVQALAGYGVIQGMSLPVVLFPSCLMMAIAEMIVPQLTEAQVAGNQIEIAKVTRTVLEKSLIFCLGIAALLFALGDALGMALYDSVEAGKYIRIFSLIVPIMYMDMITDGCLKGLGEMLFCMAVNIADAGLSALLVWLLLPRWGLLAYILIICFTELFNFALSLGRLKRLSDFRLGIGRILSITLAAILSGAAAWAMYEKISTGNSVPALIVSLCFGVILYASFLNLIKPEEAAGRRASGRRSRRCW